MTAEIELYIQNRLRKHDPRRILDMFPLAQVHRKGSESNVRLKKYKNKG
jgi:hypothetical protein